MSSTAVRNFSTLLGWTGRRTLRSGVYLLDLTTFITLSIRNWRGRRGIFNRATLDTLMAQIIFTGIDALPVITLLALAIGFSITSQILSLGQALGSSRGISSLVVDIVGVELSSLLTAIVLIGRSGSAITVNLGYMRLHHEVESLELLGIDVYDFFVTPRIIGGGIAHLLLGIYFAAIALFGGVLVNHLLPSGTSLQHLTSLAEAVQPIQVLVFLIKNLLFGFVIAGTACFHGLRVHSSPNELPQHTQRAIVTSLVLVFILDGLFAIATR